MLVPRDSGLTRHFTPRSSAVAPQFGSSSSGGGGGKSSKLEPLFLKGGSSSSTGNTNPNTSTNTNTNTSNSGNEDFKSGDDGYTEDNEFDSDVDDDEWFSVKKIGGKPKKSITEKKMKKRRLSNQLEATLFGNGKEFGRLEMSEDTVPSKITDKMKLDPTNSVAKYDPETNSIVWANGQRWIRKDFRTFQGKWRDTRRGHVIWIKSDGTMEYIEPKDMGTYKARIVGFYKIGISHRTHQFQAQLVDKGTLQWDNGVCWTRIGM